MIMSVVWPFLARMGLQLLAPSTRGAEVPCVTDQHSAQLGSRHAARAGAMGRQNKLVVTYDEDARKEYLTGFRKRKTERRKVAQDKIKELEKKARKEARDEVRSALVCACGHTPWQRARARAR